MEPCITVHIHYKGMRIINRLIVLYALLFITSCGETDKDRINRLVKEWNGKEIKFPSHSTFTVLGKDTVDFDFQDADFKVLSYIDSVGCTSCKLQLPRWKAFIREVDSLMKGKIPFLFYFHSENIKELRSLTRSENFTYPICFDENDELNRLNGFPTELAFQTYLLDHNNRVIAIGNPTYGSKIRDLYLNLMFGSELVKETVLNTKVSIDCTTIDLGNFPHSEKQKCFFKLTNVGKQLLVIQDIKLACGCTKVEYRKEPIRPGESLKLKVIYEAEQAEHFNKTIMVYCNAESSPLVLTVKGYAE